MWREGTIRIPDAKDKGKNTVCHYWVKHYEEPSETYGINGGRISKLMIKVDWCHHRQLRQGLGCGARRGRYADADGLLHPAGKLQLSREFPKSGAARLCLSYRTIGRLA